jgi:iron complex transport system substrate-binding protein
MPSNGKRTSVFSRMLAAYCSSLFLLGFATTVLASDRPQRVVSINVCTDQLVALLVERERIISLSHLARDPNSSWLGPFSDGLPLNHGTAEEVIALRPDLIVTAPFGFRPTISILKNLGYTVLELPIAKSFHDISENLQLLANAVGENKQTKALIRHFNEAVTVETVSSDLPLPLFVSYEASGWTMGNNSLPNNIAQRAGFETIGDRLGFSGGRKIDLEKLLIIEPELIELGNPWNDPPALVSEAMWHPALQELLKRTKLINIPDSLWLCGSPKTLEALRILQRARRDL